MAQVGRRTLELPAFAHAAVKRTPGGFTRFVPEPPFSRTNHFVIATEAEIAEAYDAPDLFWCAWQAIDQHGEHRLCTRGLDDLDEESWLGRTFESTMALARAAKAGLTTYYAEIYDLRALVRRKQDREGRPIDTVNVIWRERWMAMSERRPLLDVGAHVFYLDDNKQRIPVT